MSLTASSFPPGRLESDDIMQGLTTSSFLVGSTAQVLGISHIEFVSSTSEQGLMGGHGDDDKGQFAWKIHTLNAVSL